MNARSEPLPDWALVPHPARCGPSHPNYVEILRRHSEAVALGQATYADPATGLEVFTAQSLWIRGYCCDSGCRHCPYVAR